MSRAYWIDPWPTWNIIRLTFLPKCFVIALPASSESEGFLLGGQVEELTVGCWDVRAGKHPGVQSTTSLGRLHLEYCRAQVQVQVRSRSDEGQVRVRKVKVKQSPAQRTLNSKTWTWAVPYFWFPPTHPPPTHHKLFSWLLRGLDMSDGPRMGWYDSSRVWGGQDFQVDAKAEIKWDYRGDIREYFNESKIVW